MPRGGHRWVGLLFLHLELQERIGRLFGMFCSHNSFLRIPNKFHASFSALSEVIATPLPYDNVLELRDRLWEISPTLVRYDITEPTSVDVALAGLKTLADKTAGAKASDAPLRKPISNFYQKDPISRA